LGFALAVAMALGFALTNGLHDAANAIATLVSTRVARPGAAIALASVCNLIGPFLVGAAVADTVASMVRLEPSEATAIVGAGLTGAVAWGIVTWARGLPSSSSHALVGGLVGAALVGSGVDAIGWTAVVEVLVALAISPLLGFLAAAGLEAVARPALLRATTRVAAPIRSGQWLTSGWLALSHGANDTQKTVGVLTALLVANGSLQVSDPPAWAILAPAVALTVGTAFGGWRIVRTVGRGIVRVRPLDGLASQAGSAGVILAASVVGLPVSTTQVVSSSIVGTGVGRGRRRHVRWRVVRRIGLAWVITLPVAGALAAATLPLWRWIA
jgi:PiT family inorganic phosphate transporter